MEFKHAAFLSYSRHDEEWTGVLQQNLETCLESLGHEPSTVYRDRTDLAPGRSWVTGLQQGLDQAPRVILVATPESMASLRVADEWQALVANYPDWSNGRILIARAVDCVSASRSRSRHSTGPAPPLAGRRRSSKDGPPAFACGLQ